MRRSSGCVPAIVSIRAAEIEASIRLARYYRVPDSVTMRLPDPAAPECATLAARAALREAEEKVRLGIKALGPDSGPQLRGAVRP